MKWWLDSSNHHPALSPFHSFLLVTLPMGAQQEIANALTHLGEAAQAEGNAARAVRLYSASRNILDSIGAWRQDDEAELEQKLASCRPALDESTFAHSVERDHAMMIEQAIEYALSNNS